MTYHDQIANPTAMTARPVHSTLLGTWHVPEITGLPEAAYSPGPGAGYLTTWFTGVAKYMVPSGTDRSGYEPSLSFQSGQTYLLNFTQALYAKTPPKSTPSRSLMTTQIFRPQNRLWVGKQNFFQIKKPALPTFPPVLHWSIMSGAAFHFWVRDGIRWFYSPWNTD